MRRYLYACAVCLALFCALAASASGAAYSIPIGVTYARFGSVDSDMQVLVSCGAMSTPLFFDRQLRAWDAGATIMSRAGGGAPEMDEFARCLADASVTDITVDYAFDASTRQTSAMTKRAIGMPPASGRVVSAAMTVDALSVSPLVLPTPGGGVIISTLFSFRGRLIIATAPALPAIPFLTSAAGRGFPIASAETFEAP